MPFFGDGSYQPGLHLWRDTVDGTWAALDRPDGYQIYNLGRSDPVSLSEMLATIEDALGKKAGDQPDCARAARHVPRYLGLDRARARAELGYAPLGRPRRGRRALRRAALRESRRYSRCA